MTRRALSPILGTVLLLVVTLVVAGAVGASLLDLASLEEPQRPVSLSASADAATNRITLTHRAGPPLDVRDLEVKVVIDGRPLFHQPPVPFAGARGFAGAPTGPFNAAADPGWTAGESASIRLAGTNRPDLEPGASVTVTVFENGDQLLEVETTAG